MKLDPIYVTRQVGIDSWERYRVDRETETVREHDIYERIKSHQYTLVGRYSRAQSDEVPPDIGEAPGELWVVELGMEGEPQIRLTRI